MLSAPSPFPAVSATTPAPDDAQIEKKMPSICVDYLSHNWAQEDVWQSWKAMTKRKNEVSTVLKLIEGLPSHYQQPMALLVKSWTLLAAS